MSKSVLPDTKSLSTKADVIKRVILSMGGKGGVGKTCVMTSLAEWFNENQISVKLLDLDIENKARGSLTHFFGGRVPKININTPAGLDAFIDHLSDGNPLILADMGAGAGQITYEWFDRMYPIESSISRAGAAAKRAADHLSQTFHSVYWWVFAAAAFSVLLFGFACGMLYQRRLDTPLEQRTDIQQTVLPPPNPVHHTKQKP